tara:strand:- start:1414 stop:2514 length:1101 start_codon:yes stop_codon:yes gene_type:complete
MQQEFLRELATSRAAEVPRREGTEVTTIRDVPGTLDEAGKSEMRRAIFTAMQQVKAATRKRQLENWETALKYKPGQHTVKRGRNTTTMPYRQLSPTYKGGDDIASAWQAPGGGQPPGRSSQWRAGNRRPKPKGIDKRWPKDLVPIVVAAIGNGWPQKDLIRMYFEAKEVPSDTGPIRWKNIANAYARPAGETRNLVLGKTQSSERKDLRRVSEQAQKRLDYANKHLRGDALAAERVRIQRWKTEKDIHTRWQVEWRNANKETTNSIGDVVKQSAEFRSSVAAREPHNPGSLGPPPRPKGGAPDRPTPSPKSTKTKVYEGPLPVPETQAQELERRIQPHFKKWQDGKITEKQLKAERRKIKASLRRK